jgi:hypothetical protein
VSDFDPFAFLRLSKGSADIVSSGANVIPRSNLNLALTLPVSERESAFARCSSLSSISLPSSLETIGYCCISECSSLSTVTFETGSRLSHVESMVFDCLSSRFSISIPLSLQTALSSYQADRKILVHEAEAEGAVGNSDWPREQLGADRVMPK